MLLADSSLPIPPQEPALPFAEAAGQWLPPGPPLSENGASSEEPSRRQSISWGGRGFAGTEVKLSVSLCSILRPSGGNGPRSTPSSS